jgi:hypothetical protein
VWFTYGAYVASSGVLVLHGCDAERHGDDYDDAAGARARAGGAAPAPRFPPLRRRARSWWVAQAFLRPPRGV